MAVLIIFPVSLQTVINLIMLSIGGQRGSSHQFWFFASFGLRVKNPYSTDRQTQSKWKVMQPIRTAS